MPPAMVQHDTLIEHACDAAIAHHTHDLGRPNVEPTPTELVRRDHADSAGDGHPALTRSPRDRMAQSVSLASAQRR